MKNKGLLFSVFIVMVSIVAAVALAWQFDQKNQLLFAKDGYILTSDLTQMNDEAKKILFNAGTRYKNEVSGDGISFEDIQDSEVSVSKENFVHYNDGSFSAFSKGVLLNLEDVANEYVNHYSIQPMMALEDAGNSYIIETSNDSLSFEDLIWKISDNKYIIISHDLSVVFAEDDVREVGNFVEVSYIDEGVIQITSDENVWQTVSKDCMVKTQEGIEFHLADQLIINEEIELSFSKMVINADDNVELAPSETKELKVPEIDIKGVDGQDGEVGADGEAGEMGVEGEKGEDGEIGESGEAGEEGNDGAAGAKGATGASGSNGANGGTNGSGGAGGSEGSGNVPQPRFTVQEWNVTSTSMSAVINFTDEDMMLDASTIKAVILDSKNDQIVYDDFIFTNESNGAEYVQGDNPSGDLETVFSGATTFKLAYDDGEAPLEPDHEYRFILNGKFSYDGEQSVEKNFISKTFYTDSLGVSLEKGAVSTTSIEIKAIKRDYSKAASATLYIMSEEQAKDFDSKVNTDEEDVFISEVATDFKNSVTFDGLESDTKYVVRMVLNMQNETDEEKKMLSSQALKVETLKEKPKFASGGDQENRLVVTVNRALRAFEIHNPKIEDKDGAITGYRYVVSDANGNEVKTFRIKPPVEDTVILYLDENIQIGKEYTVQLFVEYDDNEKASEFYTEVSDSFVFNGGGLPALSYIPDIEEGKPNKEPVNPPTTIRGDIRIDLNGSKLINTVNEPVILSVYSDGIYSYSKQVDSLDCSQVNVCMINDLETLLGDGLKPATTYKISVSGWISFEDSNMEYTKYNFGSITTSTASYPPITAHWDANKAQGDKALKMNMFLEVNDENLKDSISYIELSLFQENGTNRVKIGKSFEIRDANVEDYLEENSITITNENFGIDDNQLKNMGNSYSYEITKVYDDSFINPNENRNDGGFNEIKVLDNIKTLKRESVPPSLIEPSEMNKAIDVMPLLNKDAQKYGVNPVAGLSDEDAIGFVVQSKFNNGSSLARNITYYAYQADQFEDAMQEYSGQPFTPKEFNEKGIELGRITVPYISSNSFAIPTGVFLFGEGNGTHKVGTSYSCGNGAWCTYMGNPTKVGETYSGMGRGYSYTFAYDLQYDKYETNTDLVDYPYSLDKYKDMPKPYILNSGRIEVTKIIPRFKMIPIKRTDERIYFTYQYDDPDNVIVVGGENGTNIEFGSHSKAIEVNSGEWSTALDNPDDNESMIIANGTMNFNPKINVELIEGAGPTELTIWDLPLMNISDGRNFVNVDCEITPYLESNYIEFVLRERSGLSFVNDREIALKVEVEAGDVKKEFYLSLEKGSHNTLRTTLHTSLLAEFLGKELTFTTSVIYDTGKFNWNLKTVGETITEDWYAFQKYGMKDDGLGFENYVYHDGNNLAVHGEAMSSLFDIRWLNKFNLYGQINTAKVISKMSGTLENSGQYDLRIGKYGLYLGNLTTNESERYYYLPKVVDVYKIDDSKTVSLTSITPSVRYKEDFNTFNVGMNFVEFSGINVSGLRSVDEKGGKRTIYFELMNLENQTTLPIVAKEVDATKENFKFDKIRFGNLNPNQRYELKIYADIGGKKQYLLNETSLNNEEFRFEFTTSKSILINAKQEYVFRNLEYDTKELEISFSVSQAYDVHVEYRISKMTSNGNIPVMNNEEMLNAGMYQAYTDTKNYKNVTEEFKIEVGRNINLIPGEEYILEILVYDKSNNVVATDEIPFEIPKFSEPVPFFKVVPYVNNGQYGLNVTVSVGDTDNVMMSTRKEPVNPDEVKNPFGEYLVCVYDGENLVSEDCFDKVYTTEKAAKVISFRNLGRSDIGFGGLESDKQYTVVIYSAIDTNMDGMNDKIEIEDRYRLMSIGDIVKDSNAREYFKNNTKHFVVATSNHSTTNASGIAFGNVQFGAAPESIAQLRITHYDAFGLDKIDSISYTIKGDNSKPINNTIYNPTFVSDEKEEGVYYFYFPEPLKENGNYTIVVDYTYGNDQHYRGSYRYVLNGLK